MYTRISRRIPAIVRPLTVLALVLAGGGRATATGMSAPAVTAEQAGRTVGRLLVIVGIIVLVVWLVRRNRRR